MVKQCHFGSQRGFPVDVTEIRSVQAVNGILITYFHDALEYHCAPGPHLPTREDVRIMMALEKGRRSESAVGRIRIEVSVYTLRPMTNLIAREE